MDQAQIRPKKAASGLPCNRGMRILKSLLRLTIGCSHPDMYRERRTLHEVPVLHLVCPDCDYAVPAVQRSPDEHAAIVRAGAVQVMHAQPAVVRRMRRTA